MHLSSAGVWIIGIIYLGMTGFFGVQTFSALAAAAEAKNSNLAEGLSVATTTALSVTPLFYLRKLYRDAFAGLHAKKPEEIQTSQSATAIYYLSRPIFSVLVSALFATVVFAAVRQFSQGHVGVNSEFVFFCAISSTFLSVGTGAAIRKIDEIAKSGHSLFRLPM